MSDNEAGPSTQISDFETQFVPQENDDEELWEVIEITGEQGNRYCVKWAGLDPATGKPWAQSWVPKHDCTDDLVEEWKRKKARKKRQQEVVKDKARTATARASTSTKSSNRRSTSSTTVKRTTRSSRSLPAEGDTLAHPNKRSRPSPGKRTSKSRTHEDDSEEFEPAPPRKRQRLWEVPDSDSEEEEDGSTKKNRVNGKMKEEFVEQETWNTDYSNEPGREPSPPSLNKANKGKQKASRVSVEIPAVSKVGPPRGMKKQAADKSKVMASKVPSNPVVEDAGSETESDDDLIPRPQKAKRTLPFSSTVRDRISAPVPAPPSARAGKGKGKLTDIDRIALREEEEEESQVISQVVLSERTPTPPSPLRRLPAQDGDVDLQTNDDYLDYHFDGEEPMYSPPSTDRRPKLLVKSRHDDSSVLVPETQPTPPSNRLRTPPRRSGASASFRTPLTSRSQAIRVYDHSSPQVSPRSSKKTPSNRPLKPIPAMTPSNFRQFQPTQGEEGEDESIYQFSSPEKGRSREAISSQRTQDMLKEMLKRKSTSSLPSRDTVSGRMKPRKRLSDIIANKSAVQVAPVHEDGVDQQTTFEEMENAYVDYSSGVLAEADSNSLPKQFDASLPEPEKSAPVADGKTLANGVHLRRDNAEEVPASLSAEQASSIVHSQSQDEDLRQQLDSAVELLNKKSQEIARLETELQTAKRDAELVRKDESRKFDEAKRQLTLAHTELLETWRSQTDQKEKAASEQLQALQHDLEEWKRRGNENAEKEAKWAESKRDLENQRDLFHEQYGKASDFASTMQAENTELQARVGLLESQLETGLKAVRGTYEVRVEKLQKELHKYAAQVRLLEETQRRMQSEDVTRRAAEWEERGASIARLEMRCEELERENEEVRVSWMKEKQEWEDNRKSAGEDEMVLRVGTPSERGLLEDVSGDEQDDMDWVSPNDDWESDEENEDAEGEEDEPQPMEVEEDVKDGGGSGNASASGEDLVYMCRWAVDGLAQRCDALLKTKEELLQHFVSTGHAGAMLG